MPQKSQPLIPDDFNERVRWNELINQSITDAGAVLHRDKNCRRFLRVEKGKIASLVLTLMKNSSTGRLPQGTEAMTYGRGMSAEIYFGRSFFSNTSYKYYSYGPGNARQ